MKPNELILKTEPDGLYNRWGTLKYYGQAAQVKLLNQYKNTDCVIAYSRNKLAITMLMKTDKTYAGYVFRNPNILFGGYGYNIARIKPELAIELINDSNNEIVDTNMMNQFKNWLLLKNI